MKYIILLFLLINNIHGKKHGLRNPSGMPTYYPTEEVVLIQSAGGYCSSDCDCTSRICRGPWQMVDGTIQGICCLRGVKKTCKACRYDNGEGRDGKKPGVCLKS